jgi:hypothetical protein
MAQLLPPSSIHLRRGNKMKFIVQAQRWIQFWSCYLLGLVVVGATVLIAFSSCYFVGKPIVDYLGVDNCCSRMGPIRIIFEAAMFGFIPTVVLVFFGLLFYALTDPIHSIGEKLLRKK